MLLSGDPWIILSMLYRLIHSTFVIKYVNVCINLESYNCVVAGVASSRRERSEPRLLS